MSFNQLEPFRFPVAQWIYDRFSQLIIYPSIWVAAAIASLGIFIQDILYLEPNWQAIALIFCAALVPYNLDRIFDSYLQKIPDNKAQLFFRKPYIWVLLLVATGATFTLLYHAPLAVKYASTAGIIPLLYGTPIFPLKQESQWQWYRLKDIPGSKAWIVGSILTYATVALPIAYAGAKFDSNVALTTLFIFVFIVTNSHIFDIRDIPSDLAKGVVTLPIMAGVRGTKIILATMNISMLLVIVVAWSRNLIPYHPEIIIATALNLIYILKVNVDTPRWIYNIVIEACLFVPLLTHWLGTYL
ncbi:MAG: prenyltransferase [Cyanobacteria bacterium J06643_13]